MNPKVREASKNGTIRAGKSKINKLRKKLIKEKKKKNKIKELHKKQLKNSMKKIKLKNYVKK